jgi:diacylglycerol O-acyltransferase / wax synthase
MASTERLTPRETLGYQSEHQSLMVLYMSFAPRADGTVPAADEVVAHARRMLARREVPDELRFLRRRVRVPRLPLAQPFFEDDPSFDVARHVYPHRYESCPAGSPASRLMADAMARPLDLSRPLWRIEVGPAGPEGSLGLLVTLHHAMGDGLFGLRMVALLALDQAPEAIAPPDGEEAWRPEVPRSAVRTMVDGTESRLAGYGRTWRAALTAARRQNLSGVAAYVARVTSVLQPPEPPPEGSYPVPAGSDARRWTLRDYDISLLDLRTTSRAFGVTIMDLLLAATANAWARVHSGAASMPVCVPVSLRPTGDSTRANLIAFLDISIPCESDPLTTLRLAHATLERVKVEGRAAARDEVAQVFTHLPAAIQRSAYRTSRKPVDVLLSNLPGLPQASCLGAPLRSALASSSLQYNAFKFTFASFGDRLSGTLVFDAEVEEVATRLDQAFREGIESLFQLGRQHRLISEQPHFAALSVRELDRLCRSSRTVTFGPGDRIVAEHDPADAFYIVQEGSVQVSSQGHDLTRLGAGSSFGEVGLVRDRARAATVEAAERVELLRIPADAFIAAFATDPLNLRPVLDVVDEYDT